MDGKVIEDIVLGWLCDGDVKGRFMDSVLKAMAQMQERCIGWIYEETGPLLASARNRMVMSFLGGEFQGRQGQWLLTPDSDMVWEKRDIEIMLNVADPENVPILGGLCFCGGRDADVWPSLLVRVPGDEGYLDVIKDYPKNTLCKVDATGTGFLLVHRSVFETMYEAFGFIRNADGTPVLKDGQPVEHPYPWFAYGQNAGRPTGEDIAFCLRARALDIPVHVHTGMKIGHIKPTVLTEELFDAMRAHEDAEKVTAKKVVPIHRGRVTESPKRQAKEG